MQNCKSSCTCHFFVVTLQPFLSRSSSYLALLERFTTRDDAKHSVVLPRYTRSDYYAKHSVVLPRYTRSDYYAAGSSSARLECLLWEQEVVSSNLAYPTNR